MSKDLTKRITTSFILFIIMYLMFSYTYVLIISLILISIISWIEFYGLISKILIKKNIQIKFLKFFIKFISLIYLCLFSFLIFNGVTSANYQLNILYLIMICIFSDIGGLIFGKIFKGKKLTKISPNKTISGSIGSFVLSLTLVPFFHLFLSEKLNSLLDLTILALTVSLSCQLGDLFISYLKRKANVKNTGDLLPGHGGFLDRIDGILFAIPIGIILWRFLVLPI
tara:strand:- start:1062 stop:1739 length:678 start_codon:yes stop_codon:yes gene_type:complete